MTFEFPPYQAIDLTLGIEKKTTILPVKGWVITCPTHGAILVEGEQEPTANLDQAKTVSNSPQGVLLHRAWIHSQATINGHISQRRFWTLR